MTIGHKKNDYIYPRFPQRIPLSHPPPSNLPPIHLRHTTPLTSSIHHQCPVLCLTPRRWSRVKAEATKAGGGGGDQAGAGGASSGYEGKVNSGKSCFFFPAPSRRERRTLLTHSQLPTALCTRRAFLSRRIAPSTRRSMGR